MHNMYKMQNYLIGALLVLTAGGCSVPSWDSSLPKARPLGADYKCYTPPPADAADTSWWADSPEETARAKAVEDHTVVARKEALPTGELTLRGALALALLHSDELASFAWSVRVAEADQLQASLTENPELETEFENFGGSGEFRGGDVLETTIFLGQLVELGGKRRKRMKLASLDSQLAGWDYEAQRLAVLTEVTKHYAALLASQRQLVLAKENQTLAETILRTVEKRVAGGKSAPPEKLKAVVELATRRIAVRRAERALTVARQALAAIWGSRDPKFLRAVGDLTTILAPQAFETLAPLLKQNPDLARWATESKQREAALALARADAVPDVTVGVGYRTFGETDNDDHAFMVAASIPLPVLNRNQGEIAKARFGLRKLEVDRRAAQVKLHADLTKAYQALASAYEDSVSLEKEVMPNAHKAFDAEKRSFKAGKSNYLDLLDAQRTWIEARSTHVATLAEYHSARAEVEALISQSLDSINQPQPAQAASVPKDDPAKTSDEKSAETADEKTLTIETPPSDKDANHEN